jgi:hypothetical protein
MPRKARVGHVQEGSAHLGNDKKATVASGEKKHSGGTLMEGIVVGLTKRVSPPIVDGIHRGIPKRKSAGMDGQVSQVQASATKDSSGAFGSGNFPESAR